eukprot:6507215-Pyramimonas_sp.AAC.1
MQPPYAYPPLSLPLTSRSVVSSRCSSLPTGSPPRRPVAQADAGSSVSFPRCHLSVALLPLLPRSPIYASPSSVCACARNRCQIMKAAMEEDETNEADDCGKAWGEEKDDEVGVEE